MTKNPINVEQVLATFEYDEGTGTLSWNKSAYCKRWKGKAAGKLTKQGYISVKWFGRRYMAHRLIWALVKRECPDVVDHINGDRADNRIENLRAASNQINSQNRRLSKSNNTTGFLGVRHNRSSQTKPFIAVITHCGVSHYLGAHATAEQAYAAYVEGKRRMHVGNTL